MLPGTFLSSMIQSLVVRHTCQDQGSWIFSDFPDNFNHFPDHFMPKWSLIFPGFQTGWEPCVMVDLVPTHLTYVSNFVCLVPQPSILGFLNRTVSLFVRSFSIFSRRVKSENHSSKVHNKELFLFALEFSRTTRTKQSTRPNEARSAPEGRLRYTFSQLDQDQKGGCEGEKILHTRMQETMGGRIYIFSKRRKCPNSEAVL